MDVVTRMMSSVENARDEKFVRVCCHSFRLSCHAPTRVGAAGAMSILSSRNRRNHQPKFAAASYVTSGRLGPRLRKNIVAYCIYVLLKLQNDGRLHSMSWFRPEY